MTALLHGLGDAELFETFRLQGLKHESQLETTK